ncbi:DUF559 domain-containing protein [Pseudonocardia sp. RS11V-5]|uniref:DUF559 domain-containing protein n=1 Tax=Pseudonocardia terrae TaxID=2905831 RepID=UPI001E4FF9F9|nr:DUF559 domain-containing protein [Pseudonocardia terrae]MCE3550106.1 DUF559 domain-containing protein [Pseudonocardia terrae]
MPDAGVVLPWELGTAGACLRSVLVDAVGEYRVRRAVSTGEALVPWPGVLADPACATDSLTMVAAAWLAVGGGAVVAGPSAAHLHGCTALPPQPVHLVVPYETRRRTRPGLVVHNGPDLAGDHVVVRGLPTLRLERVVTDLLCTAAPWHALAVADEALALVPKAETAEFRADVRARLRARSDPRGTLIGARLFDLATGRAESPPESHLLWRVVDLGYPVPQVNRWVHDLRGVPIHRLDLSWPELRIAVEYDGYEAHVDREAEDLARVADLEARGWIVIRVRKADLVNTGPLERALDAAFARRGVDTSRRIMNALRPRRHREPRGA